MIQAMFTFLACLFVYADLGTRFWLILISSAAGALILGAVCWGLVEEWVERRRSRTWPTVPAVIDIVSVTYVRDNIPSTKAALDDSHYLATLTYSYQNSDQHTGDYSRRFSNREDAEAWANSYKGATVLVHVDPHDPTHSMLTEKEL